MFLRRLGVRNFRNLENEVIEFPETGAALIGDNGQGKTNLLEAIYYLEIFRSFRGARDEQLITFEAEHFRVEGHLSSGEGGVEVAVAAAYTREGRQKKVTVNGAEPDRVGQAIGQIGAIIFTASDVEIISGGPGARRRFLDIILSLVEPGYLAALQRYRQVLSQRNELLRDGAHAPELEAWNKGLVESGSRIIEARSRWVGSYRESFSRYYAAIAGGQAATTEYVASIPLPAARGEAACNREYYAEAFHAELGRQVERERRRGVTVAGPHRDDLRFSVLAESAEVDLRGFGSAGQQRTAAIALRMMEAEALRSAHGRQPIVMLDDVFAELDPKRAGRIVDLLKEQEWGQILLASPKPSEFELMRNGLTVFRIEHGKVRPA